MRKLFHSLVRWSLLTVLMGGSLSLLDGARPLQTAQAACSALPADKGQASFNVTLPSTGNYRVWARLYSPQAGHNGFYMQVDQTYCAIVVGGNDNAIPVGSFTWVNYQSSNTSNLITLNLTAGSHTVILAGLDTSVGVDRIMFVTDTSCVPTGTGDNCNATTGTPVPTPTPTPGPPPPDPGSVAFSGVNNGATISGSLPIGATPSGATSISQIEFFIDGTSIRTETTPPYCLAGDNGSCFGWDSHTLSNGAHALKAVMTSSGGTAQTVITVTVNNSTAADTTAPSVPSNLSASALNAAQVRLSWNASTDNSGGSGVNAYRIYRGSSNTPLATATTPTYLDATVSANSSYSYRLSAVDAAGNESAKTAAANVTTPAATDTNAPSVPKNLHTTTVTANTIALAWDASSDNSAVLGYHVYRSGVLVGSPSTTAFSDGGLKSATSYTYTVSAYDSSANTSAQSGGLAAKTLTLITVGGGNVAQPVSGTIALKPTSSGPVVDVKYTVDGKAVSGNSLDTTSLSDGEHVITAQMIYADGSEKTVKSTIQTKNHGLAQTLAAQLKHPTWIWFAGLGLLALAGGTWWGIHRLRGGLVQTHASTMPRAPGSDIPAVAPQVIYPQAANSDTNQKK